MDHGDGQVVRVLAFYSIDPSSNPAEVYNIYHKLLLRRMKINKEVGVRLIFNLSKYFLIKIILTKVCKT